MRAADEFALLAIRLKFGKRALKPFRRNEFHALGIKRRKARRVRDPGLRADFKNLHMAGRVPPAPDLIIERAGRKRKLRRDRV